MQILNTVQSVYRLVTILCLLEITLLAQTKLKATCSCSQCIILIYYISMQKEGDYTYKTDVYSLGLVLYEMHHPVCSDSEKREVSVKYYTQCHYISIDYVNTVYSNGNTIFCIISGSRGS